MHGLSGGRRPAPLSVFTVIEGEVFRIIDGVVGAEAMLLWN
jgi:hypothetical protein